VLSTNLRRPSATLGWQKKLGKDFDLAMQFVMWNRLDEPFGSDSGGDVESFYLGCHRSRELKGAFFGSDFAYYSSGKRPVSIDASAQRQSDDAIRVTLSFSLSAFCVWSWRL
jgi:hypothetical protein